MRTFILTEEQGEFIMRNHILKEDVVKDIVKSNEFEKKVKSISKDTVLNDKAFQKEIEKQIKKIIADTLGNTFKTLWMRKEFWSSQV